MVLAQIPPSVKYGVATWIVSGTPGLGTHTTIAAAVAAASSGDTVFIRDGTYTESVTLKNGVTLVAWEADGFNPNVIIDGTLTCSTASGHYSMSGLYLQNTAGSNCVSVSGTVATVYITDCFFNLNHSGTIGVSNASTTAKVYITYCEGNSTTTGCSPFAQSSTGTMEVYFCEIFNSGSSVTPIAVSGGFFELVHSSCSYGFSFTSTSIFSLRLSVLPGITGLVTINAGNSNTSSVEHCYIAAVGAAAVNITSPGAVIIDLCQISSDAANVITGTGTVTLCAVVFLRNQAVSTTTQAVAVTQVGAYKTIIPAGDYTILTSDYFVGASSAGARAITLPASPQTGQTHVVKDYTGTAATHNITVGGNGVNILGSSSAANYVINVNYGSATFLYDGVTWSVI